MSHSITSATDLIVERNLLLRQFNQIATFSASLTERIIILKMVSFLSPHLPLNHDEIRKLLLLGFKAYRSKNEAPIQTFASLENEERSDALNLLLSILLQQFEGIFLSNNKEDVHNYLNSLFNTYFEQFF